MLLHQKRQDWTVSHPNSELGDVTSKKARLNRLPSKQWTRCQHRTVITKNKKWTVSQPNCSLSDIKALFHPNRELWIPKKEKLLLSQSQRTMHCYLEKDKPELLSISTQNSALLYWKRQDFIVPHFNRELTFDIIAKIKIYIYI